jgi:hypothetical protein
MHALKRTEGKRNSKGLLRREGSSFLALCGVGIVSAKASMIEILVKLDNIGVSWLIFHAFLD